MTDITVYNRDGKKSTIAAYKLSVATDITIVGHEKTKDGKFYTLLAGGWRVLSEASYQTGIEITAAVVSRFL